MDQFDEIASMFESNDDIDTEYIIENVDSGDFVDSSNTIVEQVIERDPLDYLEEIANESSDVAMRPLDVRRMDQHIEEKKTETIIRNEEPIELLDYKNKLEEVTEYVLQACKSDREEAQAVLDDLRSRLDQISGPAPKSLVEGIVGIVSVKSAINSNAIKIMDANTKFIVATKTKLTQKTVNTSSEELTRLLSNQM